MFDGVKTAAEDDALGQWLQLRSFASNEMSLSTFPQLLNLSFSLTQPDSFTIQK